MEGLNKHTNYNETIEGKYYQRVLEILKEQGLNSTMAEASMLRDTTKKVLDEIKDKNVQELNFSIDKEIVYRFFWHSYGINLRNHLDHVDIRSREEVLRDLIKYAQEKLRKDSELIYKVVRSCLTTLS